MKLRIRSFISGKIWEEENEPHSWSGFASELITNHKDMHLIYCDIECIVKCPHNYFWYILDEMGRYEAIPIEEYEIEEVIHS